MRNKSSDQLQPTVLLVDDDPLFGRVMERLAASFDVTLTSVTSIDHIDHLGNADFDVIIMDYDLVTVTGVEIAAYLQGITVHTPILLTSSADRSETRADPWPRSVRGFVRKEAGAATVLAAALSTRQGPTSGFWWHYATSQPRQYLREQKERRARLAQARTVVRTLPMRPNV